MDHRDPVINGNKKFIIIHDDISVPYILIGFYHNKRRKGRKLKSVIYDRLYVLLHFSGMRYLRINFRTSHSSWAVRRLNLSEPANVRSFMEMSKYVNDSQEVSMTRGSFTHNNSMMTSLSSRPVDKHPIKNWRRWSLLHSVRHRQWHFSHQEWDTWWQD